jgi:hypothetical protein
MANHPLWPEGVEVHNTDLQLETNSRISEDNKRLLDLSYTPGVVTGFAVSPNGITATQIDIQPGHGYTPNGEYIEITSSGTILGVPLADYTLNATNVVILMYAETLSSPRAH